MTATPDVIVVGLGAMGGAAAHALAARGRRVIGLDRFTPPHVNGSSHGRTRIIREAYFEHPLYVPLVRRAFERWDALEKESGRSLYLPTGALTIGAPDVGLVAGTRTSARLHAIPHEEMSAADARRRWPAVHPPDGAAVFFERRAGLLFPERCIEAFLEGARANGADLRFDDPVLDWSADGDGVVVRTARETLRAGALVVAAGAWATDLLPGLALPLVVERQVTFWFAPKDAAGDLGPAACPVLLWEPTPDALFYLIPDTGDGVKAARHHEGERAAPGQVRPPDAADEAPVRDLLRTLVPSAEGAVREARSCLYTNTPDRHFLVDRHPAHPQVVIASPCSGHGFKFASAIGEIAADLTEGRTPAFDLTPFALGRFAP